jgi:DNA-binding transcriptional ArsR family regulator
MEASEERLSRAISALTRRQILHLLGKGEQTVSDITQKLGISKSLASKHLTLLYDLGFLTYKKTHPYKYYSLKNSKIITLLEKYDLVLNKCSGSLEEKEDKLSRAIKAQSRRKILEILSSKQLTVNQVTQKIGVTKSVASRYLQSLCDFGFLTVKKEFPYKYYSLKMPEITDLLKAYEGVIKKL